VSIAPEAIQGLVNSQRTSVRHVRPASIIFLCSLGLAGPTCPCCASNGAGSSLTSLYSSFIFTASRTRALYERINNCHEAHDGSARLFSSSCKPSSAHEANTSQVRFPDAFRRGFSGGSVDVIILRDKVSSRFLEERSVLNCGQYFLISAQSWRD
jgi:hypothetical protein